MGTIFGKPVNTDLEESEKAPLNEMLKEMDEGSTAKLDELFDEIVAKVSIDYTNKELQDIHTAVQVMLEKVVNRVNERGVFTIFRIQPCGSMAERTSIWKYDACAGDVFTEFDFLAVLDVSVIATEDNDCKLCIEVEKLPFNFEAISNYYEQSLIMDFIREDSTRRKCDILFLRELNTCLISFCNCFTVNSDRVFPWSSVSNTINRKICEHKFDKFCLVCGVEMPTGCLSLSDAVSTGRVDPGASSPSLAFLWTSHAKVLSAYDIKLQEKSQAISSLLIHVDFLPALEINKSEANEDEQGHDCFVVPKRCILHGHRRINDWRKSNCVAEIGYITNKMSERHRKCYKILKYFLSFADKYHTFINWYHVKTIALNHSVECEISSEADGCAVCVLKILAELDNAYVTKTFKAFALGVNLIETESKRYKKPQKVFKEYIEQFLSVADSDSLNDFVEKFHPMTNTSFDLD